MTANKKILRGLLPNCEPEEFLNRFWAREPFLCHAPLSRLKGIAHAPELKSLSAALAAARRFPLATVHPTIWERNSRRKIDGFLPSAFSEALNYYKKGATVYFNRFHQVCPVANKLILDLQQELGTPMELFSCSLFASPPGMKTPVHFDRQETFLLQLRGKKLWKIAPNEFVKNAPSHYVGGKTDHRLKLAAGRSRLPKPTRYTVKATLTPGSVLYVPRGYWHESVAEEDSLGLSIILRSSTWADLALHKIGDLLVRRDEWRVPATGFSSQGSVKQVADWTFDRLLGELENLFKSGSLRKNI